MQRLPSSLRMYLVGVLLAGGLLAGCTTDASGPPSPSAATTDSAAASVSPSPPPSGVSTGTPASTSDADRTLRERLQDARLSTRVTRALADRRRLRVFDFVVEGTDGHVVVRGDVNTVGQYRLVGEVARSTEGVTAVTTDVTVNGRPPAEATTDRASEENATAVYHTVQPGESLWTIARDYQASVQQIETMNDLGAGSLQPGQRIRVR